MLTAEEIQGIGVALNEATLLGIEVDEERRAVGVTVELLPLPADGTSPPSDRRVQLLLKPVGRIAASLRDGNWNDDSAPVLPLSVAQLPELTERMKSEIYGWEFIDRPEEDFERWCNRLSLDREYGTGGRTHSMTLFQEYGPDQFIGHLDIRIWFDELSIWSPTFEPIPVEDFIDGGRRWWDKFYSAGKAITDDRPGTTIIPLKNPN